MKIDEATPTHALRISLPAGLLVSASYEPPRASFERLPWTARLVVAWARGGREADLVARYVGEVCEFLGPEVPFLVRSGDVWGPLRPGDLERAGDPRLAGKVFAEIGGALSEVTDLRGPPGRLLELRDPGVRELAGPGALVQPHVFLFPFDGAIHVQLAGALAVRRGAPGWERWSPGRPALAS